MKASQMKPLPKTFRLFSRICENCNIKTNVHSQLLLYTLYVLLTLIIPVISLPYQLNHHVIMHEVAVLNINQGLLHC